MGGGIDRIDRKQGKGREGKKNKSGHSLKGREAVI